MHNPIVVFAILASGSICHHWQSWHSPQLDAAITIAPLENSPPKNTKDGIDKPACCHERFLPAAAPSGPSGIFHRHES
jgi:hypothetical protein